MGGVELEVEDVWRRCMRSFVRYHNLKSVANLLRTESREVKEWIAGDDEELKRLLGLEAEVEVQGRLGL